MADSQSTDQTRQLRVKRSPLFWASVFVTALVLIEVTGILIAQLLPWFQVMMGGPGVHRGVGGRLTLLELKPLTGDGPKLSLADLQDHVTLLNFWGTWCPPCRAELPHMAELRRHFANQKAFRLVAVSYPGAGQSDDRQSLAKDTAALLKQLDLDLPTYYDPDGATLDAVDRAIGFEGYPTTLLLDRHGVIRAIWAGYGPGVEKEMETYVDKILSETEKHR